MFALVALVTLFALDALFALVAFVTLFAMDTLLTLVALVTFLALDALFALRALYAVFTVSAILAACANQRIQPFSFGTCIAVLRSYLIGGFTVGAQLACKRSQPFQLCTGIAVFHSKVICTFAVRCPVMLTSDQERTRSQQAQYGSSQQDRTKAYSFFCSHVFPPFVYYLFFKYQAVVFSLRQIPPL